MNEYVVKFYDGYGYQERIISAATRFVAEFLANEICEEEGFESFSLVA